MSNKGPGETPLIVYFIYVRCHYLSLGAPYRRVPHVQTNVGTLGSVLILMSHLLVYHQTKRRNCA